jgi:Short C-terminal domain
MGAAAKVDQSGAKHVIRDTRQTFLTVEGPHISLAAKLASNSGPTVKAARQFAAAVNQWSQSHPGTPPVSGAGNGDTLEQLERLGKLRDSGVLTEDEFVAQKAKLLNSG